MTSRVGLGTLRGMAITYKDAGVDIDAGDRLVAAIAPLARATRRPEVESGLGGFAGLCALPSGYRDPILVSGTDGVGTKLKTALETGRHRTIGIDLVAMSVNDVLVVGAEPLFFLDYYATGRLDVEVAEAVIAGVADGCLEAGCALLGGETAEMPGMYRPGDYDLAGFCVGVVERDQIRAGADLARGDVLIGLPSTGLHANGHSLARKLLLERFDYDDTPPELGGASLADELLRPTRIYAGAFAGLRRAGVGFRCAAHITGGGLIENLYFRNIQDGEVGGPILQVNFFYEEGDSGEFTPVVRNIVVENLTSEKSQYPLLIKGYPRSPISNILFKDCQFENVEAPSILSSVENIRFENVRQNADVPLSKWGTPR
ncbi:MAG: hypothetical protein Tsb0020_53890 [Haliangiales bacterium]